MNFASRAGDKLQFALDQFNVSVKDLVCADFGSSTGGFTGRSQHIDKDVSFLTQD